VEQTVLPAILRVLRQLDTTAVVAEARRLAAQSLFQRQARASGLPQKLADAHRVHDAWVSRLNAFFAHPAESLYSEETLAAQVREAEARVQALETQAAEMAAAEAEAAAQVADLERFLADSQAWWERFLDAPRPQQKALLRQVIDHIVLRREGFDIYYRIDLENLGIRPGTAPVTSTDSGEWEPRSRVGSSRH
jgi:hypothetical protein